MSDTPSNPPAVPPIAGMKAPLDPRGFTTRTDFEQAMGRMRIGVATPADYEKLNATTSAQMHAVIMGT